MDKDSFSANMFAIADPSNGGYHEPTHQATMIITKNGVSITLTPEEIKDVVKTAGGNFKC